MPPARTGPRYSVQDALAVIQNGESDFEMESDDADASDEDGCRQGYFISPNTDFSGPDITDDATSLYTPLEYFQKFVSADMIQALTKNTNEYSFQTNGKSVNTNTKEIEKVIGMYLKMGLVQMSGVRMYWETDTWYPPVSDVMPRNRLQSLLTSLHFVNNLTVSETEKKDNLWKLRPWLDSFREKCLQVVPEEHNSKVDEMMIHFEGKFRSIEQYMRGIFPMKYKFPMKSRRWYMYIFWHTIILAVVNAWLLYKRDCKALKLCSKEIMNRRQFQAQLASSLILVNTTLKTTNRGRPSGNGSPTTQTVTSRSPLTAQKRPSSDDGSAPNGVPSKRSCAHPPLDVRKDLMAHFPMKTKRGRCRHCDKGYTNTQCRKCHVRLCFSEDKNCFWDYHCK